MTQEVSFYKCLKNEFNFLGIALDITQDFGNFIYATEAQSRTANIMAKVAGEYGLDFVVNVGGKNLVYV